MTTLGPTPATTPNVWSKDALFAKAQRNAEEMLGQPRESWQFAFWSTLVLEMLARAALAKISPALLADSQDRNHLIYALGHTPKNPKWFPKSIDTKEVFHRLREVYGLDSHLESFGGLHMSRRNEEVHSGGTPFDGLQGSRWLPTFYQTCEALLTPIGETLDSLFGSEEAIVAKVLIKADREQSAKAVLGTIEAHRTVWASKEPDERTLAMAQASAWATRQSGHRAKCPACGCDALLTGDPTSAPTKTLKDNLIIVTQYYLPLRFECISCGLKVSGHSQLHACGLGDSYKATFNFNAADYYAPTEESEEYEPDYNER